MNRFNNKEIADLTRCVEEGLITTNQIINKADEDFSSGKIDSELYRYIVKYFLMIDRVKDKKYMNMEELIEMGFYNSMDEILDLMSKNPDDFKGKVFNKYPVEYPEPTQEEIDQYIDTEDNSRVCVICCRRRRHCLIQSCGHNIMCSVCSKILVKNYEDSDQGMLKCPICNEKIEKIQKIYIS